MSEISRAHKMSKRSNRKNKDKEDGYHLMGLHFERPIFDPTCSPPPVRHQNRRKSNNDNYNISRSVYYQNK